MAKRDRSRLHGNPRDIETRDVRKEIKDRSLITFSFKSFDQTQPRKNPQTFVLWNEKGLLKKLLDRMLQLSALTRDEAFTQNQIKQYGDFPPPEKTDYFCPAHVSNVSWCVIENIGGKPRVAGYFIENTFYVVFLDSEHRFWISKKRNT